MFFYLAGSIEYSPDLGKGWRAEITPMLKVLGHEIYDPAEDEMKNLTEVEAHEFRAWKKNNLSRFQATIRKIIAYDLDLIEHQCDAIVCYWDQYAGRGAGTQGELTFAHRMGIPVYFDGQASVSLTATPGFNYAIQGSTNLTDWISLQTNTAPFIYLDTNASNFGMRYYRGLYLP